MHCRVKPDVRLRGIEPRDHAVLRLLRMDIDLQHALLANPPQGGDADVAGWIARRQEAGALWCIAGDRDQCLGYVQLAGIHRKNRFAWLGIVLAPAARGHGVGDAALRLLAAEALQMGIRKLLLEVRADNAVAIRLYETLGYRLVGVLRAHYDDGARFHDTLIMERLLDAGAAP